jgi:hypothetical protein
MQLLDSGRIRQASLPEKTRKAIHRQPRMRHRALLNDRERCIQTLRRLGVGHGANSFLDKAMALLTRYWAETPWNGRAALLQSADWLIRVGAQTARSEPNIPR